MSSTARPSAQLVRSALVPACVSYVVVFVLALAHAIDAQTSDRNAKSVWDGVYTDAQAQRGRGFYNEHCASCHGGNLEVGEYRALTGDRFWTTWQETTVD